MTTMLANDYPVARKQHTCSDCGRTIARGERYRRVVQTLDGSAYTWKSCAHCDRVGAALWSTFFTGCWDEGFDIGEVLREYEIEPLATQFANRWAGVDADSVDVSVIR